MQRLREDVARYAAMRLPVLVEGPTGSGKELVARGLHLGSKRNGALVAFNVCAVPDTMFEDAMFGHEKGAFTGATASALGYLAEANGGTVVLDEINGLSQMSQAKLLRAIETGEFRPVGARRDRCSDFRIVSTSNESLVDAVSAGRFRADLYFRLSGLTITVPSLHQRLVDLPALVRHCLAEFGGTDLRVCDDALEVLCRHTWPGNVRELKHVVARAASMTEDGLINVECIQLAIGVTDRTETSRAADERTELLALLSRFRWDTDRVAQELAIHRATVYRRMQKFGLAAQSR